jgi:carbamoyltransferase
MIHPARARHPADLPAAGVLSADRAGDHNAGRAHTPMSTVVGVSAYFHDAACCVLRDGVVVAAAQEERFSRRKHDASLPLRAFQWCLRDAGISLADVDCVAYYESPWIKLGRQLWQWGAGLSPASALRLWDTARRPADAIRHVLGHAGDIEVCEHHRSHAASAFFGSGFREAAILTVDGVGEWATTTYGYGESDHLTLLDAVNFPDSLGLFYSTLTSYLGFAVNDGEYKVMGLAPYGCPLYVNQLRAMLVAGPGAGQFHLDRTYVDFTDPSRMYTDALPDLLGVTPRRRGDPILAAHRDLASSLQVVLEEQLLDSVRYLHARIPVDRLCMAGGVALNCVANGRLLREGPFSQLFVQPAAGDAGGAFGAAALAYVKRRGRGNPVRPLEHVFLGPCYARAEIATLLARLGVPARDFCGQEAALLDETARLLAAGRIVAWFQGRMEFGPRALGARSILADPRDPEMRDRVNRTIKEREAFRPFAPAVLAEAASRYFDLDHPSPFMVETCDVTSALPLPAITHVDGTARVQTVDARTNPRFAALLRAFEAQTGCPVLLNTSFNLRDEPIVASPADALLSFSRAPLDALVIEDFLIERQSLQAALPTSAGTIATAVSESAVAQVYTF